MKFEPKGQQGMRFLKEAVTLYLLIIVTSDNTSEFKAASSCVFLPQLYLLVNKIVEKTGNKFF